MMILKRYFPLLFAVIFATLSSVSVYHFMKDRGGISHAAPSVETLPVVVAKSPIALGERLTEENLKVVPWPRDAVPKESFQSIQPVIGRVAKTNLIENEPILTTKMMDDQENFSTLIPSNMRAVTVSVRRSQALQEILRRGTKVDVISIYENDIGPTTTKVIAQNVSVLAVHRGTPGLSQDQDPKMMEVTLIATPREAERLVAAMNKGVIQLAVRNAQDESVTSVKVLS